MKTIFLNQSFGGHVGDTIETNQVRPLMPAGLEVQSKSKKTLQTLEEEFDNAGILMPMEVREYATNNAPVEFRREYADDGGLVAVNEAIPWVGDSKPMPVGDPRPLPCDCKVRPLMLNGF